MDCVHLEFAATVVVSRLFASDDVDALTTPPESIAVDVSVVCAQCGRPARFEGPIGVAIGPGAAPSVSLNGLELRASGHMGENTTPSVTVRMTKD